MITGNITDARVVLELELQSAKSAYRMHSSMQNKLWVSSATEALDDYIELEKLATEVEGSNEKPV